MRHRAVHRVHPGERGADGHQSGQEQPERLDRRGRLGLLAVVGHFVHGLEVEPLIVRDPTDQRRRAGGGGAPEEDGRVLVAVEVFCELVDIRPGLGVEGGAARLEEADDAPHASPKPHPLAEPHPREALGHVAADDDLSQTTPEGAPGNDAEPRAKREPLARDASDQDVRPVAGAPSEEVEGDDDLRRHEWPPRVVGRYTLEILQGVEGLSGYSTDALDLGALTEYDDVHRLPCRHEGRFQAPGQGHQADIDCDDQGDARDRHRRADPAHHQSPEVVLQRDRHDHPTRRNASAAAVPVAR